MTEFEKTLAIMMIQTRAWNGGYSIIESDNDESVDELIEAFSKRVSLELKDFQVVVFDYAKDIQMEGRYNNNESKVMYPSWAMEYYELDNGLEDEDLGTVIAIYRHMEDYVLEGVTAEDKMQRLAKYLSFQNRFRETNSYYRGAYYVFPTWLNSVLRQNCPDFSSQINRTFIVDSKYPKDCIADDCRQDWFDYKRFNEIMWPSFNKKK